MTNRLSELSMVQRTLAALTGETAPHKVADNDNDYPPAVPAQAAAAMPVRDLWTTGDGLLR